MMVGLPPNAGWRLTLLWLTDVLLVLVWTVAVVLALSISVVPALWLWAYLSGVLG